MKGVRVRRFHEERRVLQQTNAAGGAIVLTISPANVRGMVLIKALSAVNSGNNGAYIAIYDEDDAPIVQLCTVTAAANTTAAVPKGYASPTTSTYLVDNTGEGIPVLPGQYIRIYQTAAGVQNDTLTVHMVLEYVGVKATVTLSKDDSTNAADVTLAANTISTPDREVVPA